MKSFSPHAQGFLERRCANRHHHEFLKVDGVVGMHTTIDDVHHRHGQRAGRGTTHIAIERHATGISRRLGNGKRHAENSIGTEASLVGRAIQFNHGAVNSDLVFSIHVGQRFKNLAIHGCHGFGNPFAEITALVTIPQLHGFMSTRRSA